MVSNDVLKFPYIGLCKIVATRVGLGHNGPFLTVNQNMFTEVEVANQ